MKKVVAVILAAGESRRMKSPKMLLPLNGRTLIGAVLENVITSDTDSAVLVLGAYKDEIMKAAANYPVKTVFNGNYKDGMLSSVRCGIAALPEDTDAALVVPGDMPFIKPGLINRMIGAYLDTKKKIVIPVFKGSRGHPILIDAGLLGEIGMLDESEGLRQLIQKFPGEVFEITADSDSILKDIDTQEEYKLETNSN